MATSVASKLPGRLASRPLLILAAAAGMLLAAGGALWARYGSAVFYEMAVAGLALCF
jgi:hypothetical protein